MKFFSWETLGYALVGIFLILCVLGFIFMMDTSIEKKNACYDKKELCVQESVEEIKEASLDCIKNLAVEEQAYTVDSCFTQVKALYCGWC